MKHFRSSWNQKWPRWWRRVSVTLRRSNIFSILEVVSVFAFVAMTITTWLTLAERADSGALIPSNVTASLLVGTLVPAMMILIFLGRRMALRRAEESAGGTGQMHVRLVFFFSLIAAIPTLLVAILASVLFQSGVEFWFSDSSRGLLENANKLARGYYEQTQRDVSYESAAMASDMRSFLGQETIASPEFGPFFSNQVLYRKLNESAIIQRGRAGQLSTAAIVDPVGEVSRERVSKATLARLDAGEQIVITASANRIEAVTPIDKRAGIFLFTARSSDLLAFSQGGGAQNLVRAYQELTGRARVLQLRFNVALFVLSLALVGIAVWFALRFADNQVKPLYQLVDAARSVGSGNFSLRVPGRTGSDEIGLLNRAFNRMTAQIERQTAALVGANQQSAERRDFIEAVLESVSAGIVTLNGDGEVALINSSAQKLLPDGGSEGHVGKKLAAIAPQLAALVASDRPSGILQVGKDNELLTLAVKTGRSGSGMVITFEDITRQVLDQRQAAWSDVARRIAHEIKNPLTPIQLATERLNRRYKKQITDNPELFEELTGTIIRQVGGLRTMVDEFSSFARLPEPVFRNEDVVDLARQALFLQEVARPDITFDFKALGHIPAISCDRHQFGQAMTNVLKNAVEAIEAKAKNPPDMYRGKISLVMQQAGTVVAVSIADNGIGLPQDRDRIVEPYVTTREKGTGLGLAIVNKIVEEHGGDMTFESVEPFGACVTLRFACEPHSAKRVEEAAV